MVHRSILNVLIGLIAVVNCSPIPAISSNSEFSAKSAVFESTVGLSKSKTSDSKHFRSSPSSVPYLSKETHVLDPLASSLDSSRPQASPVSEKKKGNAEESLSKLTGVLPNWIRHVRQDPEHSTTRDTQPRADPTAAPPAGGAITTSQLTYSLLVMCIGSTLMLLP